MIQLQTSVQIVDNSGATRGRCIKVLSPGKFASVGDIILISVTNSSSAAGGKPGKKVKFSGRAEGPRKGDVFRAVVVRTRRVAESGVPISHRWDNNAVVLVKNNPADSADLLPIGTRIRGPVSGQLVLRAGCQRLLSLARGRGLY